MFTNTLQTAVTYLPGIIFAIIFTIFYVGKAKKQKLNLLVVCVCMCMCVCVCVLRTWQIPDETNTINDTF